MSAGKNSKHIKNRFFLITDKIAQKDLEVKYAPTEQMWADINTKRLQGNCSARCEPGRWGSQSTTTTTKSACARTPSYSQG